MTKSQIEYWKLQETARANEEIARANRARELENTRHNTEYEKETKRSNVARETETERNNRYNNALGNFQTAAQVGNAVSNMARVIVPSQSIRYQGDMSGSITKQTPLDNFFAEQQVYRDSIR